MKLKENENLPSEEIFVLEGGEPIKKSIEEYTKGKIGNNWRIIRL